MTEPVLVAKGITLGFPHARPVLDKLDFELAQGESFAVMGPSGAGKTLLLKTLAGLLQPQSGSVHYRGENIRKLSGASKMRFRASVGMTFQKSGLFDSASCAENLAFVLREAGKMKEREIPERVAAALEEVGLAGQELLQVHEMSGGMQKRLGIARALLNSPSVVLYDEPTAGLDPITSHAINDLILATKKKYEMTIVLVTSEPRQAYELCGRLGFLHGGKFLAQGRTEQMRTSSEPSVKQFLQGLAHGPLTTEVRG